MKNKIFLLSLSGVSLLCSCVNVDDETSEKPYVYWKAAENASYRRIQPDRIKTGKILSDSEAAKPDAQKPSEEKFVRATDKIAAGARLSLVDLIDIALENNTSTRSYWFQAKAYAAALGKENSSYYPRVSVSANVYRSRVKPSFAYGGAFAQVGKYYETGFGPSAEISWLLCDFGQRSARVESARQALYAANFEYNRAIQEVVLNVNLAYYGMVEAIGNVDAAKLNIADAQTAYKSAAEKYKSGVGNKPDMLNALANLKNAEFDLQNAEAAVETARANLAATLGVGVNQKLDVITQNSPAAFPQSDKKIEELIAQAMRGRQDLLAVYAQLKQSEYDIKAAKRNFLPKISASADASLTDYTQSGRDDQNSLQAGVGISWSIFEGFARKYDLISAKMKSHAAAQKLKQQEIQIMADVWSAFYSYKSALKQVASADAAVAASEEAYKATKIGYESGVNSITDFLNAQNRLASARQQRVLAVSTLSSSVAKLAYSVGAL